MKNDVEYGVDLMAFWLNKPKIHYFAICYPAIPIVSIVRIAETIYTHTST